MGSKEEAIGVAGDPGEDKITLPSGPFVTEGAGVDVLSLSSQANLEAVGNCGGVIRRKWAPHRKKNPTLGRAVDLHPEITAMPAAGLKISPQRRFCGCDLAVKRIYICKS